MKQGFYVCHYKTYCISIILAHFLSYISCSYMTSSIGAIIPQSMMILPQTLCLACCQVKERLLSNWLPQGHTIPWISGELFLPFACSFSCWCAQLVLSQETGNLGERPPSIPRIPVDRCGALWLHRQETLHLSQYNSYCLGPVEYGPAWYVPSCVYKC